MLSLTRVPVPSLVWEVRSHLKACVPSPIMYVLCAPGKNSGACCHFLFQGILIQGSNPCFWCLLHILHWQADSEPTGFHVSPTPSPHTQNELHSNGVSKPEGGLLQNYRLEVSYGRIVNYRPQGENFNKERVTNDNPQEEEVYTASPTRTDYPSNSVNENWSSLLNSDFSFQTKLPSPLLFSIMFFFFVGLPYGFFFFFNSSLVPNCNNSTIPG